MRIESAVTSQSWIPSVAVEGVTKLPFELGAGGLVLSLVLRRIVGGSHPH